MHARSLIGVALLVASCSGSKSAGSPDAGGTPMGSAPKSLNGTWDVTWTSQGGSSAATVTIADGSIIVVSGMSTVTFAAKSAVNLMWGGRTFTGTHSATGSVGFMPIDPLGDWSLSDRLGGFTASVTSSTLTATCTGGCSNDVTGSLQGHFSGTKLAPAAASSSWGDLAGTWHIADSGGYACDVTLINATFQATCGQPSGDPFTVTASASGDLVSGTASRSNSYELSAHRR